jgi:hypothetical protein
VTEASPKKQTTTEDSELFISNFESLCYLYQSHIATPVTEIDCIPVVELSSILLYEKQDLWLE